MELARHPLAIVWRMSCSASHGGKTHLSLTNAAVQTQQKEVGVEQSAYTVWMVSAVRSLSSTFANLLWSVLGTFKKKNQGCSLKRRDFLF